MKASSLQIARFQRYHRSENPLSAKNRWGNVDIRTLPTPSALAVGVGTPTDQGVSWTPSAQAASSITLGGGIPDPETLPVQQLHSALTAVLLDTPADTLRYGGILGFEDLRQVLADRYTSIDRLPLSVDNFIMANGGAGGIANVCEAFVEPGDVVLVKAPTFSRSLRTFRGHMAEVLSVPVDDDA